MSESVEITEYKALDGFEVSLTLDDARRRYCQNATDREVAEFLMYCKVSGANPLKGDAYLVKYGTQPASIQSSIHFMNARAQGYPDFDGIESGVIVLSRGNLVYRRGSLVLSGEELVGGWAEVYSKLRSHGARSEVSRYEYDSGKALWRTKPATMIEKVAKAQALRLAYPVAFSGVYTPDEVPAPQPVENLAENAPEKAAAERPAPALEEGKREFMAACTDMIAEATGRDRNEVARELMQAHGNPLDHLADWEEYAAKVRSTADAMCGGAAKRAPEQAPEQAYEQAPEPEPAIEPDDIDF